MGLAAGCGVNSSGFGDAGLAQSIAMTVTTMALVVPTRQGFAQTMNSWCLANQQQEPAKQQQQEEETTTTFDQDDIKTAMLQQMGILLAAGMCLSLGTETQLMNADNHILSQLSLAFYGLSILSAPTAGGWVSAWLIAFTTTTLPWMLGHAMFAPLQQPADIAV